MERFDARPTERTLLNLVEYRWHPDRSPPGALLRGFNKPTHLFGVADGLVEMCVSLRLEPVRPIRWAISTTFFCHRSM